jgi:hypothetical protein
VGLGLLILLQQADLTIHLDLLFHGFMTRCKPSLNLGPVFVQGKEEISTFSELFQFITAKRMPKEACGSGTCCYHHS